MNIRKEIKKKNNRKAFTLAELATVIMIIAIMGAAIFLGGATIVNKARVTKARANLKDYASYMETMFYKNPGYASEGIPDEDVVNAINHYLSDDMKVIGTGKSGTAEELNDAWGTPYRFIYNKVTNKSSAGVLIWSCGANQESESVLNGVSATIGGDDIGVAVKMIDGEVSIITVGDENEGKPQEKFIIKEGCRYITADKDDADYDYENQLPMDYVIQDGDKYETEDYVYMYNFVYDIDEETGEYAWVKPGTGWSNGEITGWSARARENKETYESFEHIIVDEPVKNLYNTFKDYTRMQTTPSIENDVVIMYGTFRGCTSLLSAPSIPDSVINIKQAFKGCSNLTDAPDIHSGIVDMSNTFESCNSLVTPPDMSDAVSVMNMNDTFAECSKLETAPIITESVINMARTFKGCTSLTGTITINANPAVNSTFANTTKPITLTGDSSKLGELAATGNGNVTVG